MRGVRETAEKEYESFVEGFEYDEETFEPTKKLYLLGIYPDPFTAMSFRSLYLERLEDEVNILFSLDQLDTVTISFQLLFLI